MSQSYPRRTPENRRQQREQNRRRVDPGAEGRSSQAPEAWALPPLAALLVLAIVVALVIAAGIAIGAAVKTRPYGAFANCKPAAQLTGHSFSHAPAMCIRADRTYVAKLNTTRGRVDIVMPAKNAPATVNNFIVLSANGFYDGLSFHRAESWVVQGGDPLGDGSGGPGYSLPPEGSGQTWATGSVGMARFAAGPINGSQFFLVRGPWPGSGPGDVVYNQFGTVLGGVEVVNQLTQGDRILSVDLSIQS